MRTVRKSLAVASCAIQPVTIAKNWRTGSLFAERSSLILVL